MEVDYVRLYQKPETPLINEWPEIDRSMWFVKASSSDAGSGIITEGYWPARTVKVHGVGNIWFWRSAEAQDPAANQWFKVDMGQSNEFKQLRIIAPGYTADNEEQDNEGQYAAEYTVQLSDDPIAWESEDPSDWGDQIDIGRGSAITDICFPGGRIGRYLTIRQIGTSDKKWSIRDIYAYKEKAYSGAICNEN